jgi:hypothetical protein
MKQPKIFAEYNYPDHLAGDTILGVTFVMETYTNPPVPISLVGIDIDFAFRLNSPSGPIIAEGDRIDGIIIVDEALGQFKFKPFDLPSVGLLFYAVRFTKNGVTLRTQIIGKLPVLLNPLEK